MPNIALMCVDILSAANAYVLILLGIGRLFVRRGNPVEVWGAVAFITGGTDVIVDVLQRMDLAPFMPHILYLTHPLEYTLAPSLYIFFNLLVDRDYRISRKHILLFLPAAAVTAVMLPYFLQSGAQILIQGSLWNVASPLMSGILYLIDRGTTIVLLGALSAFSIRIGIILARGHSPRLHEARSLWIYSALVLTWSVVYAASLITQAHILESFSVLAIGYLALALRLLHSADHHPLEAIREAVSDSRYRMSKLENINVEKKIDLLRNLMEQNRIYLDEELDLTKTGKLIGLSPPPALRNPE